MMVGKKGTHANIKLYVINNEFEAKTAGRIGYGCWFAMANSVTHLIEVD